MQLPMYACHEDLQPGCLASVFEAFEARPLPLQALAWKVSVADDFIAFARQHLAGLRSRGILPPA